MSIVRAVARPHARGSRLDVHTELFVYVRASRRTYRIVCVRGSPVGAQSRGGPEPLLYILLAYKSSSSRKHNYIVLPLKSHFYIVKLGFTGVYINFLISSQNHRLWVLVRTASPRQFSRLPTIYVLSRNMKNIRVFI